MLGREIARSKLETGGTGVGIRESGVGSKTQASSFPTPDSGLPTPYSFEFYRRSFTLITTCLSFAFLAICCGGGGGSSNSSPPPPPSGNCNGTQIAVPTKYTGKFSTTVSIAAGNEVTGVNIAVPPENLPTLVIDGVGPCTAVTCTTAAAGAQLAQGQSATILVTGQGIIPGTAYSVPGSQSGVTVAQPSGSDFGTCQPLGGGSSAPCVTVNISVSASAPLGPRNIEATNAAGELSVFVGGLNITAP